MTSGSSRGGPLPAGLGATCNWIITGRAAPQLLAMTLVECIAPPIITHPPTQCQYPYRHNTARLILSSSSRLNPGSGAFTPYG